MLDNIKIKNICNFCFHKTDFELDAKWVVLFATSHGKKPFDGIVGTVTGHDKSVHDQHRARIVYDF